MLITKAGVAAILALTGIGLAAGQYQIRATERACAWAERADMYDDCAKAFSVGGSPASEKLRHWYGDPTGE